MPGPRDAERGELVSTHVAEYDPPARPWPASSASAEGELSERAEAENGQDLLSRTELGRRCHMVTVRARAMARTEGMLDGRMTRRLVDVAVLVCLAIAGCDAAEPASDAPPPAPAQTAEQAAQLLCEKAGELGPGSQLGSLELSEDELTNPRVRTMLESLAQGASKADFFAGMKDILGHEWACPPMHALFSN